MIGPLTIIQTVIKTKSLNGLYPIPIALGFVSAIIWLSFGIYIKETPSIITNFLGLLSSIVQIGLYVWVLQSQKHKNDGDLKKD